MLPLALFAAALGASIFGSMVGLGGGFLLVPILRLLFGFAPAEAAGTSLALVVASSASASVAYFLQRRVHVKLGFLIALGGFPGAILGSVIVHRLSSPLFDWIFAAFLLLVATDIIFNRHKRAADRDERTDTARLKGMPFPTAILMGFAVGLLGGTFGIGGGIILVPTFIYFSALPAQAISATSQFAILLTSPIGLTTHILEHDTQWAKVVPLVAGGLLGGPIGARFSSRLHSSHLLLFVAGALILAAISLTLHHFIR